MLNSSGQWGYSPQNGGRGGYGAPVPRRFSLPPAPYGEERPNYYDQNRSGPDRPKNRGNKQNRRSRETRSQSRSRQGGGGGGGGGQNPQQSRGGRRRSMDSHAFPPQSNRRQGGSRDPSPHVWEMTNTANYQQTRWRQRDHSPMHRSMTDNYGDYGAAFYHDQYRPRSREASPGFYGPQSPVYGPQSPVFPGPADSWYMYQGRRAHSRDPSPHYGDSGGYMYRSLPRRTSARDPSPHQFTRDRPPRHYQKKPSSRPNSRDPSPNYGDFGYVRTVLFDRRPTKDQQYPPGDTYCDSYNVQQASQEMRRNVKGKFRGGSECDEHDSGRLSAISV